MAPGQASYPYPYTYPPPLQPFPGYPPGYPSHPGTDAAAAEEETGEGSDAWEAAQNILKAINFAALIQLGEEAEKNAGEAGDGAANGIARGGTGHQLNADDRAALQAQLALLAAQMAELAEGEEDAPTRELGAATVGAPTTKVNETNVVVDNEDGNAIAEENNEDDEDDDDDMEMVDVP